MSYQLQQLDCRLTEAVSYPSPFCLPASPHVLHFSVAFSVARSLKCPRFSGVQYFTNPGSNTGRIPVPWLTGRLVQPHLQHCETTGDSKDVFPEAWRYCARCFGRKRLETNAVLPENLDLAV